MKIERCCHRFPSGDYCLKPEDWGPHSGEGFHKLIAHEYQPAYVVPVEPGKPEAATEKEWDAACFTADAYGMDAQEAYDIASLYVKALRWG